jgi:hypothetical protein
MIRELAPEPRSEVIRNTHFRQVQDVSWVARGLSDLTEADVIIVDAWMHVSASHFRPSMANGIMHEAPLSTALPAEAIAAVGGSTGYQKLLAARAPVTLHFGDESRGVAQPVVTGGRPIGSIWLLGPTVTLQPPTAQWLSAACLAASMGLPLDREEGLEETPQDRALRLLLMGDPMDADLDSLLDPDSAPQAFALVGVRASKCDEKAAPGWSRRLDELLSLYSQAFSAAPRAIVGGTTYILIFSPPDTRSPDNVVSLTNQFVRRARSTLNQYVVAGVSALGSAYSDIERLRWEVDRALRILSLKHPEMLVATLEDVLADSILIDLQQLRWRDSHLTRGRIETLMTADRASGTNYLGTLRAYLDCFGDVRGAARRLHVHQNTLRYRLRRLVELSGVDLGDADERLLLEMQLRCLSERRSEDRRVTSKTLNRISHNGRSHE